MARGFNGSNQYFSRSGNHSITMPLTIACWFYTDDGDADQVPVRLSDFSEYDGWNLYYEPTNDEMWAESWDSGGSSAAAVTTSSLSLNTWHHVAGVFASTTSRAAYLDGGSKGTNTDSITAPANLDMISIGVGIYSFSNDFYVSGRVAEVAIWDVALSDDEVAMLGAGFSPLLVRLDALYRYWPLIGRISPEPDLIGDTTVTGSNAPPAAEHPPIIYAPSIQIQQPTPAAPTRSISVSDDVDVSDLTTALITGPLNYVLSDNVVVSDAVSAILSASGIVVSDSAVVGDSVTVQSGVGIGSNFPASLIGV